MSSDREACLTPDLYSLESSGGSSFAQTPSSEVSTTDWEQQHQHQNHQPTPTSRGRQALRGIHQGISKAFKNIITSARPSRSKNKQAQANSQTVVDSPINRHCQPSVQPLNIQDRVRGRPRHSSPSLARIQSTMLTEARELFEKYGVDRPPG